MNDWLEQDNVPEDTKATMYAQQLQRANQLNNQVFRPEPFPVQMITHTEPNHDFRIRQCNTPNSLMQLTNRLLILFQK